MNRAKSREYLLQLVYQMEITGDTPEETFNGFMENNEDKKDNLDLDLNASSPYLKESLEALRALGYTKTEVKRISKKLEKYDGKSTDDYLRQGLRLLMS